ncbi:E2/UBC family protein [Baekduia sp.]|uniref:E2/UBC family protein n=1 Tax=Baekduia sp. TaxID=2600305 RepID=UPI002DFE8118|nr:E2/UBC family protein [Baekduia sp.]
MSGPATTSVAVARAIDELKAEFGAEAVASKPDGDGGAFVRVSDLDFGPQWRVSLAELRFHLPYNYPDAAIYPYYLLSDLERLEGNWPDNVRRGVGFDGGTYIQASLRFNRWNPGIDTAAGAVHEVCEWLRTVL